MKVSHERLEAVRLQDEADLGAVEGRHIPRPASAHIFRLCPEAFQEAVSLGVVPEQAQGALVRIVAPTRQPVETSERLRADDCLDVERH